ncbi:hypothetical protein BOA8489_03006 [Boseongicola aestuarii]|uniref:Uncharacterized protein n=1 Tax=Boseongicola aestuarii TaxID=1470561 RepID=A0A238J3Y4_9RHOB|nr:hypothetical protein BOA8489_03006 [Boseongicola aestuarii]
MTEVTFMAGYFASGGKGRAGGVGFAAIFPQLWSDRMTVGGGLAVGI